MYPQEAQTKGEVMFAVQLTERAISRETDLWVCQYGIILSMLIKHLPTVGGTNP